MHFDALTLAAIAAEIDGALAQGRVQQVVQPDERSFGLEIYAHQKRQYLLLSAHPQASRVHLVAQKIRRGVEKETPLLLLLRKYVRGARMESARLPIPFERVLYLHFDHPQQGSTTLVVEPMGRLSNLILLDGGNTILDALQRVPAGENARRVILPRRPYELPPAQEKLSPLEEDPLVFRRQFEDADDDERLHRLIVRTVAGVSPTLAREVVWRATGSTDTKFDVDHLEPIQQELLALWRLSTSGEWRPGVALDDESGIRAFAPYEIHFSDEFLATETISEAVARFFGEAERDEAGSSDTYAGMRNGVQALLDNARRRVEGQLRGLDADEPEPGEAELLRTKAEWLLALSSQIAPGAAQIEAPLGTETLIIELSDRLTPVEQAERMFDRAAKMERAAKIIPRRRRELVAERAYLDQLLSDLELAQDQPEIASVREALREAGYLRRRPRRQRSVAPDRSKPLRYLSPDGFAILVGRNARQNEIVTFDEANAEDLWLHVRNGPGAHVVVRSGGQRVGEDTLRAAAQLAAYHSRRRGERAVDVVVTSRRHVNRMAGGRPGQVFFRQDENITVPAEMPEL